MVILVYHYFSKEKAGWLTCTVTELESHLRYLERSAHVLSLREGLQTLEQGRKVPRRSVAIAVDDADTSFYNLAWPIFKQHRIPVFCSLVTGHLGGKMNIGGDIQLASLKQLEEMVASGLIEFGSHSSTHPHFNQVAAEHVRSELSSSKEIVAALQGFCDIFCYPYGNVSVVTGDTERHLSELGYQYALTTCSGRVKRGMDRLRIGRTNVTRSMRAWHLPFYSNGFVSALIHGRKVLRGERFYSRHSPGGLIGDGRVLEQSARK